ncbi:type II 3-dehydroquinate dehydratase [Buchnera aphidicola]|uniref:type II 3-dehydroquinate dehydratase n=1 Tax=Buchnera aphidicola TaxID=9 RepID=UPI00209293BA|nr:type II 3-dehydroquinate dehydratase [Buchnera aphidicola]USS94389.1 type II 3-dehydroquinate dehydratase [Buchnera aphidicola (Sipha maydis)]WII23549.1 type II 3-dehydroquinate dehydratase [Buchnera aphidicola (Sipha maydis)]
MKKKFNILLLNGPNLNLLGTREKNIYGKTSFSDLIQELLIYSKKLKINLVHLQSNAEHILIDKIHNSKNIIDYIIINPAAFAHTSISLRDALLGVNIPFIEIHISNIYARENFRAHSWISDISSGIICGLGLDGYKWALKTAVKRLSQ